MLEPIYSSIDALQVAARSASPPSCIVAAMMQVANTIRLAAFARRREIGIMRLVGASSLYIQLPFLLEALVAALIGVVLAGAALGTFMWFGVAGGHPELDQLHAVDRSAGVPHLAAAGSASSVRC